LDRAQAELLARKVVDSDEHVFSCGVISYKGESLGSYVRPSQRSKYPAGKEAWANVDFANALVLGAASKMSRLLSEIESVVYIRQESIQMLVGLPAEELIVATMLAKSVDALEMSDKLRRLLLSRGTPGPAEAKLT
jgi:hypothetical protein